MNPAEVAATQIANPAIAEITVWSMFWNAHIVVKFVMLGLLSASVWCWAIIVDKTLLFRRVRKAMERFEDSFWSGNSLEELRVNWCSNYTKPKVAHNDPAHNPQILKLFNRSQGAHPRP